MSNKIFWTMTRGMIPFAFLGSTIMFAGCLNAGPGPGADVPDSESATSDSTVSAEDVPPDDGAEAAAADDTAESSANDSSEAAADDSAAAAATPAAVIDHRVVVNDPRGERAAMTWRDYGNGYIQLKSGTCYPGAVSRPTCQFILRADGGRTTFHSWGPMRALSTFVNGKYTIAKSRHPYVKVYFRWSNQTTYIRYAHLY